MSVEEEAQLTELNKVAEVISPVRELAAVYLNRARGLDTKFMTATEFLKMLGFEKPSNGDLKEVRLILGEILGKKRKTCGFFGWDVPMSGI